MTRLLTFLVTIASGYVYFVLGMEIWVLAGLFILTLATRFNSQFRNFGMFAEMLFFFCLIAFGLNQLSFSYKIRLETISPDSPGLSYPYSLILILGSLVVLIFSEGPEWSKLYFGFGETKKAFKLSILMMLGYILLFGGFIYFNRASIQNPVPVDLPIDVLIVLGIGFAFYLAIVEETIFRSFILERAQSAVGMNAAIPIQGAFYGLMHYKAGVPGSFAGIVLGSLFGMGLGYLVKKSDSIYLSIFVQFGVTLFIFLELAILGKFSVS